MKILIVEDDQSLALTIQDILEDRGYETMVCFNFRQAYHEIRNPFDCYLLDNRLPDGTGLDLCKLIREQSKSPILFISSDTNETSILKSFECEADDYIEKPLRLSVLLAKIEAVLKRAGKFQTQYKIGNSLLDTSKKSLQMEEERFELSISEIAILECLFQAYPNYISREDLAKYVFNKTGHLPSLETLTSRISGLKKKLGEKGKCIDSLRHVGTRWLV
ncbi:MAG: response regulator transcription factor [Bacillota bacterium]|nr:response regulator transcription factor [Bacillota bacterium]